MIYARKNLHMPTQTSRRKTTKSSRSSGTRSLQSTRRPRATRKSQARSHITTDPQEIQNWVESRGGHPSTVVGTGGKREAGVLRIDYPGYRGQQKLREISWDKFFDKFEESGLAFVYQDKTATGRESRFSKLVRRKTTSRKKAA